MPWVRFDDGFPEHRKVATLSDAAFRLHVQAVHWCARHLTDGVVDRGELSTVTRLRKPDRVVAELVARGLWHEAGQVCDSEDCPASSGTSSGWIIHDYLEYQPSKEKATRERKAKAERQKRWSEKRKGALDASIDASQDASKDAAPHPHPHPPRRRRVQGAAPEHSPAGASEAGAAGRAGPTGPPVGAEQQTPPPSCSFEPDPSGTTCIHCGLPAANRSHRGGDAP